MQIGRAIYGLGKGLLAVAGLSAIGAVVSCMIWPGEPCLGGLIGGLVFVFSLVPGLILFVIGRFMTRG
jgi:hypothetical protein